jgi:hypothetical protein
MGQVSMVTRQEFHDRTRTLPDNRYLGIQWSIDLLDCSQPTGRIYHTTQSLILVSV